MFTVNDFITHFETKVKQFTDEKRTLEESDCIKLGKKDPDSYPFTTQCCVLFYCCTICMQLLGVRTSLYLENLLVIKLGY